MKLLTPKDTAERLGITARWLRELSKQGELPKRGEGKTARHPWPDVREAYNRYIVAQAVEKIGADDYQKERTALVRTQRRLAELDLAKKTALQIDVDVATSELQRILQKLRARLLNLPGRVGPVMVGLGTVNEAVERLDQASREILAELVTVGDEIEEEQSASGRKRNRAQRAKKTGRRAGATGSRTASKAHGD